MSSERPLVLLLAGVDSGGGAGITADVLSVHDHGGYALPCVTALTAQSLKQVAGVSETPWPLFEQMTRLAVWDFEKIKAVKVGLVTHKDILESILRLLEIYLKDVPVVWDPVLNATAGRLESADLKGNLERILKVTTVFTPNLPEALELAGWDKARLQKEGVGALCQVFRNMGAQCVIIKGGHTGNNEYCADTVSSDFAVFEMRLPHLDGDGAHGGGCALSSSLAALLARGIAPHDAAVIAKAYVYAGIRNPAIKGFEGRPPLGHHGMVSDIALMPGVFEEGFPSCAGPFKPCPENMGLYPVVDGCEWLERLLKDGVKTIQLRIKDKQDPDLYAQIEKAVALGKQFKARVFIDDYYELAIKAGAYGVHLGMEDLRTADLEKIRKAGLHLGVSTHGLFEVLKALQLKPSYIALGHIFPTQSKKMPSKPQGTDELAYTMRLLKPLHLSTVAIGGIKLNNLDRVLATGVGSVALITGITKASDPDETCREWLERCGDGGALGA